MIAPSEYPPNVNSRPEHAYYMSCHNMISYDLFRLLWGLKSLKTQHMCHVSQKFHSSSKILALGFCFLFFPQSKFLYWKGQMLAEHIKARAIDIFPFQWPQSHSMPCTVFHPVIHSYHPKAHSAKWLGVFRCEARLLQSLSLMKIRKWQMLQPWVWSWIPVAPARRDGDCPARKSGGAERKFCRKKPRDWLRSLKRCFLQWVTQAPQCQPWQCVQKSSGLLLARQRSPVVLGHSSVSPAWSHSVRSWLRWKKHCEFPVPTSSQAGVWRRARRSLSFKCWSSFRKIYCPSCRDPSWIGSTISFLPRTRFF